MEEIRFIMMYYTIIFGIRRALQAAASIVYVPASPDCFAPTELIVTKESTNSKRSIHMLSIGTCIYPQTESMFELITVGSQFPTFPIFDLFCYLSINLLVCFTFYP